MQLENKLEKAVKDLQQREKLQEIMKAANKIVKSKTITDKVSALVEIGMSESNANELLKPDYAGRLGFPGYRLTNNNNKIKTLRKNVENLKSQFESQSASEKVKYVFSGDAPGAIFPGGYIDINYDAERMQLFFDEVPNSDQRKSLKTYGWKWAPSNKAWQRFINERSYKNINLLFPGIEKVVEKEEIKPDPEPQKKPVEKPDPIPVEKPIVKKEKTISVPPPKTENVLTVEQENLKKLKQKYPIVLEWTEGKANWEDKPYNNLSELEDLFKTFTLPAKNSFLYIKNKIWFRGIPHYIKLYISDSDDITGDYNPKMSLYEYLKHHYPMYDFDDLIKKGESDISTTISSYKDQIELNRFIEKWIDKKGVNLDNFKSFKFTSDELTFLKSYSGYGGLSFNESTPEAELYEFYTPKNVIKKMWGLAYKHGYNDGPLLETSAGTGEVLMFSKPEIRQLAYEINPYSAIICQILYPGCEVRLSPFERHFIKNNDTIGNNLKTLEKFDLVIGNCPFGSFSDYASKEMYMGELKHVKPKNYTEYFLRRSVDLLNTNGLCVMIIGAQLKNGGKMFLDTGDSEVKRYINNCCDLVDAYRLPDSTFERTSVTTDIIVLKKNK